MSKLMWDQTGERTGETGVKQGVLYPWVAADKAFTGGVAWNGLTSIAESPTGAEATPFYADDQKYLEIMSAEEFAGSIGAFMYPDKFKPCIGEADLVPGISVAQQNREIFGLCYRTTLVNDTNGMEYGYKIHLVYNARASVSEADHTTINDSPELIEFSWEFTTTPVEVPGMKPSAHLIIDSTKFVTEDAKAKLKAFEDILYGTDAGPAPEEGGEPVAATEARLPMPAEIAELFAA